MRKVDDERLNVTEDQFWQSLVANEARSLVIGLAVHQTDDIAFIPP
jgi:hypothetical protein